MMWNNCVCYFYLDECGQVAYVGKANKTLPQRVYAHSKEQKFIEHSKNYVIKYQVFKTEADMNIAEKCYIKSLKPVLNVVDNTDGFFPDINIDFDSMYVYDGNLKSVKSITHRSYKKKYTPSHEEYCMVHIFSWFWKFANTDDECSFVFDNVDDPDLYVQIILRCSVLLHHIEPYARVSVDASKYRCDISSVSRFSKMYFRYLEKKFNSGYFHYDDFVNINDRNIPIMFSEFAKEIEL